jgi:flavocytochrome c
VNASIKVLLLQRLHNYQLSPVLEVLPDHIFPHALSENNMAVRKAIVVGSGLAGLSATSTLLSRHIPVLLLDRAPKPGGNSIKASSGISAAPTRFQTEKNDSAALFAEDTFRSAGALLTEREGWRDVLIKELTTDSKGAVDWLVDDIGVELSRTARLGGHSRARTHRGAGKLPPGFAIISALLKQAQSNPLFELRSNSEVTQILRDSDGVVTGVRYKPLDGKGEGEEQVEVEGPVIFAAGGFAGDASGALKRYRPDLAGIPSTNDPRPGAHKLLTEVGATLVDMEYVQVHPTGFIDTAKPDEKLKFLAAEALRGEGGVLLNTQGRRFVNELATRKEVTEAMMKDEKMESEVRQWDVLLVLDRGAYEAAKSHVDFYVFKGLMRKVSATELNAGVRAELEAYGQIVGGAAADPLGRTAFGSWTSTAPIKDEDVFYVGNVTPVIHFTMGGARINADARVLDADERPIEGLWAAGEITGGIHGENRLGGSSLLECVIFGRKAGEGVAKYLSA